MTWKNSRGNGLIRCYQPCSKGTRTQGEMDRAEVQSVLTPFWSLPRVFQSIYHSIPSSELSFRNGSFDIWIEDYLSRIASASKHDCWYHCDASFSVCKLVEQTSRIPLTAGLAYSYTVVIAYRAASKLPATSSLPVVTQRATAGIPLSSTGICVTRGQSPSFSFQIRNNTEIR